MGFWGFGGTDGTLFFDISVPPSALDDYVHAFDERLKKVDETLGAYVYGHIADGNLHITITNAGQPDDATKKAIENAVYQGVNAAGGSFSAEHGVGSEKETPWLAHTDVKKQQLAHALKAALDPGNHFNRGKVPF